MNTRQKLTLGIAAIFMVTLTIIGVTYAYFVTQIGDGTGADETVIVTETATIGAHYADNDSAVTIDGRIPGNVVYKAWSVVNDSVTAAAQVALTVTTTSTQGSEFVHSSLTDTLSSTCYVASAKATKPENCFNDTKEYDNIYVSLVQVDELPEGLTETAFFGLPQTVAEDSEDNSLEKLFVDGTPIGTEMNAPYTDVTLNFGTSLQPVNPDATNYYILKVEYREINENQNIENLASVKVIPSIDDTLVSTTPAE